MKTYFKNIFAFFSFLISFCSFAQCDVQVLHDDYSNPSLWTPVISTPGSVTFSGGTLNYNDVHGSTYERVYRSLPSALPNSLWTASCAFMPVTGNGPSHYVMAFTAGPLDPLSYDGTMSYAATNQDAIMVYYIYQGGAPSPGCCPDPHVGPWQIVVRSKKGNVLAAPSTGISIFSLSQYSYVKLQRLTPALVCLHAYSDSTMINELAGSPVYYCIDPTITGLNTVHQGSVTWSGYYRALTAKIDDLNICYSLPGSTDTTHVTGCAGTLVTLYAPAITSGTHIWSPGITCSSCSQISVTVPVTGTDYYSVETNTGCAITTSYFSVEKDPSCSPAPGCFLSAGNDTAVCPGTMVRLRATPGFATYSWSPGAGLSDSTIANPVAHVIDNTQYVVTGVSAGNNLFVNGDFSLGNTGFTSGLNFTSFYSPGNYYVAPTFFLTGYSTGDHTPTPDQMFMSVDGSSSLTTLWQQAVSSITPSTNYQFSFWCTDGSVNAPVFEIHFIGNVTGDVVVATIPCISYPTAVWSWSQYFYAWNSGPNTSVTVRIVNLELNGYGNDFGLDDFSLNPPLCIVSDTVNITVNPPPSAPFTHDTSVCQNTVTFPLQATGTDLLWYNHPGDAAGSATPPVPATGSAGNSEFYVTQTIAGCESDTAMITVTVKGLPLFTLDKTQPECSQKTKEIGPADANFQYLWMDGSTASPRLVSSAGNYILTASNSCGSSSDSVSLVFEECHCYFYLPNAFTPNSNGINDEFRPLHDCFFDTYHLQIFDRWGEIIFDTKDPAAGWDGTFHGHPVELGVYVVHIDYTAKDESGYYDPKSILDKVTVIR